MGKQGWEDDAGSAQSCLFAFGQEQSSRRGGKQGASGRGTSDALGNGRESREVGFVGGMAGYKGHGQEVLGTLAEVG